MQVVLGLRILVQSLERQLVADLVELDCLGMEANLHELFIGYWQLLDKVKLLGHSLLLVYVRSTLLEQHIIYLHLLEVAECEFRLQMMPICIVFAVH